MVMVVGVAFHVAVLLGVVSLVTGTGLTRVQSPSGSSNGNCLETSVLFVCTTTGDGATDITFDTTCSEETGLTVLRHSMFQGGLQEEVTCSTDSGKITITNISRSPTKECNDTLQNEMDYCYLTVLNITLYESSSCRLLQCDTLVNGTSRSFGNASIANEPPAPLNLHATQLLVGGQTTVANFTWTVETNNCTADKTLKYRVNTINCGSCPENVDIDDSFIVCESIAPGQQCNISVKTITPCNAVSVPETLSITGLESGAEETKTQSWKEKAIIGGAVGGGVLVVLIVIVVAVSLAVKKSSCSSKSDSRHNQVERQPGAINGDSNLEAQFVAQDESSINESGPNQNDDSYDHQTPGIPSPVSRSGESSVMAFRNPLYEQSKTDIPDGHHDITHSRPSRPVEESVADDIEHSQTVGIRSEVAHSPVAGAIIGDNAINQKFADIDKKHKAYDAKFAEQENNITSLRERVEQLTNRVTALTKDREVLQKRLEKEESEHKEDQLISYEKIEQLKTEVARKEKELVETKKDLAKTKKELKILQEQRVAPKRDRKDKLLSTM